MNNLNFILSLESIKIIFLLGLMGFMVSMLITPLYTNIAYRYQWWKKPRTTALTGEKATEFQKLHASKHKRNIPTMAGLIMLISIAIVTLLFNRSSSEVVLPLLAMILAGIIGLIDDLINIRGQGKGVAGLRSKLKFILIASISLLCGGIFYYVLNIDYFYFPGLGDINVGWLIIPIFAFVVISTANAVNISDGLDGLAGGLLATAFGAYSVIALLQGREALAAFCITIVGSLLSYIWFNVYPARFFMGDSGSFSLGIALGVVAMITNTLFLLPIIGFVFVAEAGSVILQTISKKLRNGKKIFRISPIHHHFEAIGWPETKVTMRFWVLGQTFAFIGLAIAIMAGFI